MTDEAFQAQIRAWRDANRAARAAPEAEPAVPPPGLRHAVRSAFGLPDVGRELFPQWERWARQVRGES